MTQKPVSNNLQIRVFQDSIQASQAAAERIAQCMQRCESEQRKCVLGLATGSTPRQLYQELIRMHRESGLSFGNVVTFNLDEYLPMQPDSPQSYVRFMKEKLFDHIDICPENIHLPDGTIPDGQVVDHCRQYEEQIIASGGIDIQVLGIGRTGHIGFNEPGAGQNSLTRCVELNPITVEDATKDFGSIERVPKRALTMGVGTILRSRQILMLAFGPHKASIIQEAYDGEITSKVPATYLQTHPNVEFLVDQDAAKDLSKNRPMDSVSPQV